MLYIDMIQKTMHLKKCDEEGVMKNLIYIAMTIAGVALIGSGHALLGCGVLGSAGVLAYMDLKEEKKCQHCTR